MFPPCFLSLNAISDFASYFLQAPSNPFSKSCKDLNDLIVGSKFKCAILITSYPRQIKSLCVKSSWCWITYKRSIYWINVRSNFILMWLTADFGLCKWDFKKNTQIWACIATLHRTCLFLLWSFQKGDIKSSLVMRRGFLSPLSFLFLFWRARREIESTEKGKKRPGIQPKEKSLKQINPMPFKLTW